MSKFIIGAGVAGLIAKFYNPDYTIISPDIGGQLTKQSINLVSFFIDVTPENTQLLKDLGYENPPIKVRPIRYIYKGKEYNYFQLSPEMENKLLLNKLKEYDEDNSMVKFGNLKISNDSRIEYYDIDIGEFIKRLKGDNNDMIYGKVKLINNRKNCIYYMDKDNKLKVLKFEKIISTAPAPEFFNMLYTYENNYKFRYLPTVFVLSMNKPPFMTDPDAMYYVYDDELPYNRVQKYSGHYLYELTGAMTDDELNKYFDDIVSIERRYVGLIISEEVDDLKNIKFIGRTAEWNAGVKISNNIQKAMRVRS